MSTRCLFALVVLFAGFSAPSAARAQSSGAPGFTLDDALGALARSNGQLVAARGQIQAAGADVVAAGLWSNPQIGVLYTRSVGFTTYDPTFGYPQVTLSQFVETAGVPGARRAVALDLQRAALMDVAALRLGLALNVQSAFFSLAAAQGRAAARRETVGRMEHARQIVQARVDAGAAPAYDASRIALAVADARAALSDAEADVQAARGTLEVSVGPGAAGLAGDARADAAAVQLPPLAEMEAAMLAGRPDLRAAAARADAARDQVSVARRSVFPGFLVSLGAALGAGYGDANQRQFDLVAGVTVPLPVVDRGQGTIPAARARADAASLSAQAQAVAARQQLRATWAEAVRRREALAAWRELAGATSTTMIAQAEAGYREGRLSVLELVDAYLSARDALLRGVDLSADAQDAAVRAWRAAGAPPR